MAESTTITRRGLLRAMPAVASAIALPTVVSAPSTGAENGGIMNHIPSQLAAKLNASQVPTSEPQHDMLWACLRLRKDAYDWVGSNSTTEPEARLSAALAWGDQIVMDAHATTARGALLALETLVEDMRDYMVSADDAFPMHLLREAIEYLRSQS